MTFSALPRLLAAATAASMLCPVLPAVAADVVVEAPERVVCRSSVALGSIITRDIHCMTVSAWNQTSDVRRRDQDYSYEALLVFREPADQSILKTGTAAWEKLPQLRLRGRLPYVQLARPSAA